jgi:hypothetical protein
MVLLTSVLAGSRIIRHFARLAAVLLLSAPLLAQAAPHTPPVASGGAVSDAAAANPWSFSLTVDGYVVPHGDSYASPIFTADHDWLHLEARYNYEDQDTGSFWLGYNWKRGHTLTLVATPMVGGIFGNTTGIAPGYEVSVTYKKISLFSEGEYVFDTKDRKDSFFFNWPELIYSPLNWFHVGVAAQQTKVYRTDLITQSGPLVGFSRKKLAFTAYVLASGWNAPTVVLEASVRF